MLNKNKLYSVLLLSSIILNIGSNFLFTNNYSIALEENKKEFVRKPFSNNLIDKSFENKQYVEGEVIIKYKENKKNQFNNKVSNLKNKGFEVKKEINSLGIANIKSKNKTTKDLINEIKKDKDIEYVQPNFIYKIQSFIPNDINYDKLWGLNNTGQNINGVNGIDDIDIDWPEAMNIFSGSTNNGTGTLVAVIDTGINYNHEDLVNKMWDGSNCVDKNGNPLGGCITGYNFFDGNKDPIDTNGHGTHVAGIIAAQMNNEKGIVGVNPKAIIMNIKGLDEYGTTADLIDSIYFAKYNGAKIINASWGGYFLTNTNCSEGSNPLIDLSLYNAIKDFRDAGGLFIAAAGNSTKNHENPNNRMFPAGYGETFRCGNITLQGLDNIISVASITNTGGISSFSDYGSKSVHIGAPGTSIYSTIHSALPVSINKETFETTYYTGNVYSFLTGGENNNFGSNYGYNGIWGDINYPFLTGSNKSYIEKSIDLSNSIKPKLEFNIWCDAGKGNYLNYTDYMSLSFSSGGSFVEVDKIDYYHNKLINISSINGKNGYYGRLSYDLENFKSLNFKLRFTWVSDEQETTDLGCMIYGGNNNPFEVSGLDDGEGKSYKFLSGTSMAAPHVAGLASLAWSYRQDLNYLDIKNAILNSGDDLLSLSGKTITGKKINAHSTLQNLAKVGNINGIKIYTNNTKEQEIITLSKTSNIYIEWLDDTNPYILSGYVLNVKNGSGETIFTQTTKNKFLSGVNINKTGFYNFSVYTQLLNNSTGGLITSQNIYFDLNPDREINFLSGAYTKNQQTKINFLSNKNGTYTLSGDLTNIYTGNILTGVTLDIELTPGDGVKNILLKITDEYENFKILTGSIILDSTSPTINNLSIKNGDIFSTGSITITGSINDQNNDKIIINNNEIILNQNGIFSYNISLNPGKNNINFEIIDKAGNSYSTGIQLIRIGNKPNLEVINYFGKLKFNLIKEFAGTGIIIYGTGELNNTLTGVYSTGETLEISVLPETTYYFRSYFINNSYNSLISNTGSFKTPSFIKSNISGEYILTGITNIIDGTNSGVIFTQAGLIILKTDDSNYIKINTNGLEIRTQNGSWDGIIKSPKKVTSSGTINLDGYSRIDNLTFKIGSDSDNLIFSGGKVEVNINVGSDYNGKTLKIYRSGDNQKTFEFLTNCLVNNSICKFETDKFSYFTFLTPNPIIPENNNSGGGGGGWGGGGWGGSFYIQKTEVKQTETKDKKQENNKQIKINKKTVNYNGYELVYYEGYTLSKKVQKIAKTIIDYKKINESSKKNFINNLNNFLIAKYELDISKEKTIKLKNKLTKQTILLRNSINKLNQELKKKK